MAAILDSGPNVGFQTAEGKERGDDLDVLLLPGRSYDNRLGAT